MKCFLHSTSLFRKYQDIFLAFVSTHIYNNKVAFETAVFIQHHNHFLKEKIMLEKFSVRKPFTVLVGIILVVVLGVVSFMNTSTDLMPSIDLPFTAIFTTHIGSTPEQVERDISIPLETRLSTLSGIRNVQSISSEHVSIIILEFTESTNMDSASLEIREALDMITLPDDASRPMTIRMNPEMMPIMMANIYMADTDIVYLSDFTREVIAPALEGVPGVAVVGLSGLVNNQLNIVIEQERIDAVNQSMVAAFSDMTDLMAGYVEIAIVSAVEAASGARMAELLAEGLTLELANAQLQAEMPYITETVIADVTAAMGVGNTETPAIGIPAEMLTVDMISMLLTAQNFSMPAGMITHGDTEYMVRIGDTFNSVYDIKNMLLFDPAAMGLSGMQPIRLSDVANVYTSDDSDRSFTRVNGNPAIMLSIQRQSEYPTADVANSVRARLDGLVNDNTGLGYAILMDQGEMIGVVIGSVSQNLIIGGILAIIILLLFLRDIRPTLIVAVSIPVSIMLAFTLMYFSGVSLNMVSMGALALAVGMLVDNSIVVIENIYRMRASTDRSVARAAVSGAKQVSGAIFAATLSTAALFAPIVFTGGMTRQIFQDFGLTIAYALIASLIIALTVVPAASSIMLKNVKKDQEGRFFAKFVNGYEKALRFSLRFKWLVLGASIAAFILSFWAINQRGMILFPNMDTGQIEATANMPEGSTFEDTVAVAIQVDERIRAIGGVETVGTSVGGGGMMGMMAASMGFGDMGAMMGGGTTISIYVLMEDNASTPTSEVVALMRDIMDEFELEAEIGGGADMTAMMVGDQISIRIEGSELDDIRDTAIQVAALINSVEGTFNVTDVEEHGAPEMRVSVNRDMAMANGLTTAQIFLAAMNSMTAPESSTHMTLDGRRYQVIVSDSGFIAPDWDGIANLQLNTQAGYINLTDIADIYESFGFTSINRINRNRFTVITAEVLDGYNTAHVNAEIERLLADFEPIGSTRIIVGGEAEALADAMGDLMLMLALGVLFTYLIMVAQFQSLLSPFIIMFTIPLAFTGGFLALFVTGMSLSIVAIIGLILLSGVAVNNGIVLISRVNQMRWEGLSKKDAIIDAGRKRIRPIIMTAISTIAAMSVIALGFGEGMEMMQPMAVATIGGLFYATVMTLFVVPVLYDMFHRNKDITKEDLDAEDDGLSAATKASE